LTSREQLPDNRDRCFVGLGARVLLNLPNYITLTRIASIPALVWIMSSRLFDGRDGERELLASGLFVAASVTDGIDGYLARRWRQTSNMGTLLDPLADKLLIAAALIVLVQLNPEMVPVWVAVLVIGREFLISGLRAVASAEGFTIQASDLGKLKMVLQIVAVVAAILDCHWHETSFHGFVLGIHLIARMAIWFMVVVSLVSAIDYFVAFWSKIERKATRHRKLRSMILRHSQNFGVEPAPTHIPPSEQL
jgi:CDP-diacylglycerol--glycerol-3-phosphate 3-phosphatidyltransferase